MEIINIGGLDLEKYDLVYLQKSIGADLCIYEYESCGYEGWGKMLVKRGELYDLFDLGHCSCYGPLDNQKFNGRSFNDLIQMLSKNTEMYGYVKRVFDYYNTLNIG